MIRTDQSYQFAAEEGQDVFDLALQEYGSIEHIFDLLRDNADTLGSPTEAIAPGTVLEFRRDRPSLRPEVQRWFREQQKRINTHNLETPEHFLLQETLDLIEQESGGGILINSFNPTNYGQFADNGPATGAGPAYL